MFLRSKTTNSLIRVLELQDLYNPHLDRIAGCNQAGEEEQDPVQYPKSDLVFPSGESLPQSWTDQHFQSDDSESPSQPPRQAQPS